MSYPSYKLNKDYDTLCPPRLRTAVNSAMRYFIPAALKTEWFSPANAESKSWSYLGEEGVKVYIQYGGRELFRDEIVALAERMKGAEVETILREVSLLTGKHRAKTEKGDPIGCRWTTHSWSE